MTPACPARVFHQQTIVDLRTVIKAEQNAAAAQSGDLVLAWRPDAETETEGWREERLRPGEHLVRPLEPESA